ncbi:hypothetical protein CTU88_05320 [Streptomyces sp. JV178]|jgi:hypothetical protein|uniref:hypothetical protein n=1 Tax=unclassified Streptomyces TaxID=2593676 RepID=UPI000C1B4B76|nr:hypothetical protein [Streptomyces sp. JV178]PIM73216.1 hypothetical protein CTU88_05320 [Streptomyces sp. JV178]
MSSVHTLRAPSSPAQAHTPWRTRTPGQAQPWRSLTSLGLDPDPEGAPDDPVLFRAPRVPALVPGPAGVEAPGVPDVVESAPVPRRPVRDHHPIPQEA